MPLYVGDYLSDTSHLTAEEHGAYLLLIMAYWQSGRSLPNDAKRLALIARVSNERWTDVERTLQQFFNVTPTEWQHERIEAELERYRDKVEKAKKAGKASARKRKGTDAPTGAERTLQRTLNNPDPYPDPKEEDQSVSHTPEPAREDGQTDDPNFEKCKLAFNGSTNRLIDEIKNSEGPYGTKARAAEWLADTIDDFGAEAILDAFRFLERCRGEGQKIRDPKSFLSKNAQRAVENKAMKQAKEVEKKAGMEPYMVPLTGEIRWRAKSARQH